MTTLTRIQSIQGTELYSPLAGKTVSIQGVMTGRTGHGIFVQDPEPDPKDKSSSGIFVFVTQLPEFSSSIFGALVEITGKVLDFARDENDRPTTQIVLRDITMIAPEGAEILPVWLDEQTVPANIIALARRLNNLEGMLVGIRQGAVFSAPSNPFGDYVVLPKDMAKNLPLSRFGTAILDPKNPERWLPSFRINRVESAPVVNVGDRLAQDVIGPLNYRAASYQVLGRGPLRVERIARKFETVATPQPPEFTSVLTLNAFNLDQQLERAALVDDAARDIDHDVADQRFEKLAAVIVKQAGSPAIVALQEIQDNDGAEISPVTDASYTFERLIQASHALGGPLYLWADIAPESGADGGQPGGNIRNAFLYDPMRVALVPGSLQRIGNDVPAFEGSRKALMAHFRVLRSNQTLAVINVHLASKRHQNGIFAPIQPGFDSRLEQRVAQAEHIRAQLDELAAQGLEYFVTGDFNDFDFSPTLRALCADRSVNLMETLPRAQRYDYNHRGKLHTLMHAVVSKRQAYSGRYVFEILHGNELTGIQPGTMGTRATDHAYVITHLKVGG